MSLEPELQERFLAITHKLWGKEKGDEFHKWIVDNRPPYYALCYIMRVSSTGGGGGGGGGGGSARVTTDDTPPSTPADGDLWWNSTDGRLKIYYQDPDGYQWVDASPPLSQTDYIKLTELKSVVAASSDFADFQSRIAAL